MQETGREVSRKGGFKPLPVALITIYSASSEPTPKKVKTAGQPTVVLWLGSGEVTGGLIAGEIRPAQDLVSHPG